MRTDWQSPHEIPSVRVLRVTLRGPVTLGHVLFLDELGSPVVRGESISLGDLSLAVLVCSMTEKQARKALRSRFAGLLVHWWGRRCAKLAFDEEADRFNEWFSEQCGGPTIDRAEDSDREPKPLTSPWYHAKLASAMAYLHLSMDDAIAMPVKRLNQLLGAYAETQGNVSFVTPEIDKANEIIEQAEKRWLERLREQNA